MLETEKEGGGARSKASTEVKLYCRNTLLLFTVARHTTICVLLQLDVCAYVSIRQLTYADVCQRMLAVELTYADVCQRMLAVDIWTHMCAHTQAYVS